MGVRLLQRSLAQGRLGHAYLFTGSRLEDLEELARNLAKTLNCHQAPPPNSPPEKFDACENCPSCRRTEHGNHADVHWVRPESKLRVIKIEQIRDLMQEIHLKPTEATYKLGIIVAADRLSQQAANAFLKTLEEPPQRSILVLLSTEPGRLLETILSRCLRLNFGGSTTAHLTPENRAWIEEFSRKAGQKRESLMSRYLLLDQLLQRLEAMRGVIEKNLAEHSPLETYPDADKQQKEQWEDELKAAVEAEYRRQRSELLLGLQWWLRDVWLLSQPGQPGSDMLFLPGLPDTAEVARRISPQQATNNLQVMEQLQRWLGTNVQEALALEVGLLKLNLG